ncbi:MAG: hypothetical protein LBS16_03945 [Prevotellaceae bacterium]|jgi:hypothetical protein|nr:hypothetical protein [Prevotellaceae bacterium]
MNQIRKILLITLFATFTTGVSAQTAYENFYNRPFSSETPYGSYGKVSSYQQSDAGWQTEIRNLGDIAGKYGHYDGIFGEVNSASSSKSKKRPSLFRDIGDGTGDDDFPGEDDGDTGGTNPNGSQNTGPVGEGLLLLLLLAIGYGMLLWRKQYKV